MNAASSDVRNAARRWFVGIGSPMERRSTAVPDIRIAVARDRHNGLCASLPNGKSEFAICMKR